jgi:hypothetical protein
VRLRLRKTSAAVLQCCSAEVKIQCCGPPRRGEAKVKVKERKAVLIGIPYSRVPNLLIMGLNKVG